MDVIYKIEAEGRETGIPRNKVVITNSGELALWLLMDFFFSFPNTKDLLNPKYVVFCNWKILIWTNSIWILRLWVNIVLQKFTLTLLPRQICLTKNFLTCCSKDSRPFYWFIFEFDNRKLLMSFQKEKVRLGSSMLKVISVSNIIYLQDLKGQVIFICNLIFWLCWFSLVQKRKGIWWLRKGGNLLIFH